MALLFVAAAAASATLASSAAAKQPNILFLLTDDQDALLNGYDPAVGVNHMTNLNTRVRAKGALFTNYYLAYPLCSPSRAAILTGTFPHNHGLTDNSRLNTSTFHPVAESRSVNTWLQKAGYDTMLAGKYMNGYHSGKGPDHWARYVPPGWSSFYGFQTVDFFGTAVNVNGVTKVYPKADYQTDIIANISLAWMRETYNQTKPFFMFITPHAPHAPYTPAPRHKGTLAGLKQPVDPAFNLPDALQQLLPGNLAHLPVVNASQMDTIYESRAEALLAIDEMIGHLLDEVSALGVEDNTYFFFTCDNGYHLGQHRMPPGKREVFQHDINVPFIVSGPGITPKATIEGMAANYDFAATWAELAGATPFASAPPMDGKSLVPLMLGKAKTIRTYTLQEGYQSCEAGHGEGHTCGVRAPGGGPSPPAPPGPPTPFACAAAKGQFCPHPGKKCGAGEHLNGKGTNETLAACQALCLAAEGCDCLEFTPHPEAGGGKHRCKISSGVSTIEDGGEGEEEHDVYVPSTTTTSGDTYSDDETHVDSPELGDNNYRDYSGLRMKQHPFQGKLVDAMYVEYTGAGSGPERPEPGAKGASFYDCALDPWQTKDLYGSLSATEKAALSKMLAAVKDCKGSECP